MKKIAVLLAIALVLGVSLAAYAGATKYVLQLGPTALGTESGFVIVNCADEQKIIGQFQVRGLAPGSYWAHSLGPPDLLSDVIEVVKVNKSGSGHLHAMNADIPPGGFWLAIANTDAPLTVPEMMSYLYTWVD